MLKAARISALTLLLACSARAGIMQNEVPAQPPSQPGTAAEGPAVAGCDPTAGACMQDEAPSALTQIALDTLSILPSLF
jgi:hypothetical protein